MTYKSKILNTAILTLSASFIFPAIINHVNASTKLSLKTIETPDKGEERVLITYKNTTTEYAKDKIESKGEVKHTYENINAVSLEAPSSSINELKNNPNISSIEKDTILSTAEYYSLPQQTITYGPKLLNTVNDWNNGLTGEDVRVAIIDSGIANHSDLIIAGGKSFVDYTTSYSDDNGHGTHVAGIVSAENNSIGIVGTAPDSKVFALKVLDSEGDGYLSSIVAAIDWSIENKMDIINLSLGTDENSPVLETAIQKAYNSGVLVVAAAGNEASSVLYPAAYDNAIAVSAVDQNKNLASFSNRGPEVEVSAPGVDIISLFPGIRYKNMSGTSMATPFVTGVLALWKQEYPNATVSELRSKLDQNVIDLGTAGRDSYFGYGLVQAPPIKVSTPKYIKASNVTSTSARLDWSTQSDATSYTIKRNGTVIYTGSSNSFVDSNLTPHTYYEYKLYANSGNDVSIKPASTAIISYPPTPSSPSNFSSNNITGNSVTLSWGTSNDATYYEVKRNGTVVYKGNSTSFTDTNLNSSTSYNYTVTAGNYGSSSSPSSLNVSTLKQENKTLDTYVFSTYSSYSKGSKVYIGVYSRYNGNQAVPWARFDITVLGPNGTVYKDTKYTNESGNYIVGLQTNSSFKSGTYTIKVLMSKQGFPLPTSKNASFSLK
ncbi:S8 family serine peptidase [Bacillus mexicanus]|uniref:S8 family serine peptidase n=1 Tax=Bacillus mexicanus TaxID=2834415 RepID=UPI003D25BE20